MVFRSPDGPVVVQVVVASKKSFSILKNPNNYLSNYGSIWSVKKQYGTLLGAVVVVNLQSRCARRAGTTLVTGESSTVHSSLGSSKLETLTTGQSLPDGSRSQAFRAANPRQNQHQKRLTRPFNVAPLQCRSRASRGLGGCRSEVASTLEGATLKGRVNHF